MKETLTETEAEADLGSETFTSYSPSQEQLVTDSSMCGEQEVLSFLHVITICAAAADRKNKKLPDM